ncbi:MAG: M57 family metalloprotease [Nocardioides sp.]|uniref:M57 family metalloprotease n=1 Tax=Nocardioides sp. TaxID=35761 RepID=UPI0032643085
MSRTRALITLFIALGLTIGLTGPAEAKPRKWPKGAITYVDLSKDPDAVKIAVKTWNKSGLNIHFKKVKSKRKARVVIQDTKKVPGGCGTGYGTLGYPGPGRKAFVSILHGTDADGQGCAFPGQAQVVTHELGHVLGLTHYMAGCSLMNTSHINGVAPSQCIAPEDAKPGIWHCRLLEPIDLKRIKRIYGGKPKVSEPAYCDAIDMIPATGAVTPMVDEYGYVDLDIVRAPEPAVPGWIGTWGLGMPGYEVHITPGACTAVAGDDATTDTRTTWDEIPVGGTQRVLLNPLPVGPNCITVWQFDQGYNFAKLSTSVIVEGTVARATASRPVLRQAFRTPAKTFAN